MDAKTNLESYCKKERYSTFGENKKKSQKKEKVSLFGGVFASFLFYYLKLLFVIYTQV